MYKYSKLDKSKYLLKIIGVRHGDTGRKKDKEYIIKNTYVGESYTVSYNDMKKLSKDDRIRLLELNWFRDHVVKTGIYDGYSKHLGYIEARELERFVDIVAIRNSGIDLYKITVNKQGVVSVLDYFDCIRKGKSVYCGTEDGDFDTKDRELFGLEFICFWNETSRRYTVDFKDCFEPDNLLMLLPSGLKLSTDGTCVADEVNCGALYIPEGIHEVSLENCNVDELILPMTCKNLLAKNCSIGKLELGGTANIEYYRLKVGELRGIESLVTMDFDNSTELTVGKLVGKFKMYGFSSDSLHHLNLKGNTMDLSECELYHRIELSDFVCDHLILPNSLEYLCIDSGCKVKTIQINEKLKGVHFEDDANKNIVFEIRGKCNEGLVEELDLLGHKIVRYGEIDTVE